MYDFSRCKLCGLHEAAPVYRLSKTTVYACAACDFHFIDHLDIMPADASADSVLDDKSLSYIERNLPPNQRQHRKNLALVKRHCRLSDACCLDIGAGAGVFSALLAPECAEVHGIEPQQVFREFSLKRFGLPLSGSTVEHPQWQDGFAGYFDVITLWDVLEHVNFPAETLRCAAKLLKPGGWLFLDTPCRNSLFYRLAEWAYRAGGGGGTSLLESLYSPQPFRHKQIFTRRQLFKVLEEKDLVISKDYASPFTRQNKLVLACYKSRS